MMSTQVQGLLHTLSRDDLKASLKFLTLVGILILLPDREFAGLFGLNPRLVWMAVVFVAGLGLLGCLLARVIRPTKAILITGAIGGCFSPNMAVVSLAEQAKRHPEFTLVYTMAAAIASTMLFPKTLVVVWFVDIPLAISLLIPFVAMTAVGVGVSVLLWFRIRDRGAPNVELKTPFRVRTALVFGAVVAVLLMVVNATGVAIHSTAAQTGIVLLVVVKSIASVTIAWVAGVREMAQTIAVILLFTAGIGLALVLLA